MTYIAKNMRFLRKMTGLSQHDFAQKVDLNRGNIASYEKGTAEPSTEKLLRITKFFHVDLTDFIEKNLEEELNQKTINISVKNGELHISQQNLEEVVDGEITQNNQQSTQILGERSVELKKILEGFKNYYQYKSAKYNKYKEHSDVEKDYLSDYFRLLEIAEDILDINRQLLHKIVVIEKD